MKNATQLFMNGDSTLRLDSIQSETAIPVWCVGEGNYIILTPASFSPLQ